MAPRNEIANFNAGTYLQQNQKHLEQYAMTDYKFAPFIRSIKLAINSNEDLMKIAATDVGKVSLLQALEFASSNGLSLNPIEGKACLVPRGGKISYELMKNGLVDLAMESGAVSWVRAEEVRDNDEYLAPSNPDESVVFRPAMKDRGAILGFFAEIKLKEGSRLFKFMNVEEIAEHKKKYSPHSVLNELEYGLKTVLKRLCKKSHISKEVTIKDQSDIIDLEQSGADDTFEKMR